MKSWQHEAHCESSRRGRRVISGIVLPRPLPVSPGPFSAALGAQASGAVRFFAG
jgi:hypothetical protein